MIIVSKARAILDGRSHIHTDDLDMVFRSVLRHRVILNFTAQSESITVDDVLTDVLMSIDSKSVIDAGLSVDGMNL
jgi:MoxR-like ATPase